ncbi:cell division protein ZapA [Noviherbaspirillum denitrificans]|uniref:Cell division protein ZapA n=1 Tax=Noviherbaspirillum denitrificans TaxID=1968433 RepID=A0A254TJ73_9BURK|nr:cell division protein ZapA [Noviherbaspirillum denitrificans]OWW22624.1 cell division protein ZapA [Noviherbaspirillum denitrificans]
MIQLDVTIMGQAYRLACKEGEEETLKQAVQYLDDRMCNIRDAGKVKGTDRIAVMAALGIAAELLASKSAEGPFAGMTLAEVNQKIAAMHTVLDAALAPQENLF